MSILTLPEGLYTPRPFRGARIVPTHPLSAGLYCAFPLNEVGGKAYDAKRPQSSLTFTNNPTWANGGLRFVASSTQYAALPSASVPSIGSSAWTIAVLFRTTDAGTATMIPFGFYTSGNANPIIQIEVNHTNTGMVSLTVRDPSATLIQVNSPLRTYNDGKWHLAVGTSNKPGGTTLLYVDGVAAGSAVTPAASLALNLGYVGIRNNNNTFANAFTGDITGAWLWVGRSFSAGEVGYFAQNPFGMFSQHFSKLPMDAFGTVAPNIRTGQAGLTKRVTLSGAGTVSQPSLSLFKYRRFITDSNSTALVNFVSSITLTSSNFDFSSARSDGGDIHVYDQTNGTFLPIYLYNYSSLYKTGTVYYLAANTSHTHVLYYGNPSLSSAPNFASVFPQGGSGFDTDWGTLTTATNASGKATIFPDAVSLNDKHNFHVWRLAENPILSYSMLTAAGVTGGSYTGVRECTLPIDGNNGNKVTKVNGKYYITFARRSPVTADKLDSWRAEGTSKDGPWTNFTQIYITPSGSTIRLCYPSCVLKVGTTYYCYLSYGWDTSGATTPGMSVYLMTSSDMITWTTPTQIVTGSIFTDQVDGTTVTDIGNPWVIKCNDGKYMLVVEGHGVGGGHWGIYGCIANTPDSTSWTALNSGNALTSLPSSGDWDYGGYNDANPKVLQLPDNTYVMQFNGSDVADGTISDWQHGFATSTDRNVQFTKVPFNPVAGRLTGSYGFETSHFSWDEDGTSFFNWGQRYASSSSTASIYRLYGVPQRGGLLTSSNDVTATDAAMAGLMAPTGGGWVAESRSILTGHRANNSTPMCLSLMNYSSLPACNTTTAFSTNRVLELSRWTHDTTDSGNFQIIYWDTSGTRFWWTGSAWSATNTYLAADHAREVIFRIIDDNAGNYLFKAFYADDGTDLTPTTPSIAKTSVRATPAGRLLAFGDPFTNAWSSMGLYLRQVHIRPYAATEPALVLGNRIGGRVHREYPRGVF
jgi:hypothetical protein